MFIHTYIWKMNFFCVSQGFLHRCACPVACLTFTGYCNAEKMTYKTCTHTQAHTGTHNASAAHWQRVDVLYLRLRLPACCVCVCVAACLLSVPAVCVCAWACLMLHTFRRCSGCGCNDMPKQRQHHPRASVTATTTSTSTSTCHKYQYKRGGRGWSEGEKESCEVATQRIQDTPLSPGQASVLNTFRTYLKCCSLPPPPPSLPLCNFSLLFLISLSPLYGALSSATLFLHDLPHGYSSICRSSRNLHIIYNAQKLLKHLSHLLAKHTRTPAHTHKYPQTHPHTQSTFARRCLAENIFKVFDIVLWQCAAAAATPT